MFSHPDPNRDLATQQAIFGSRTAPKPTLRERFLTRILGKKSTRPRKESEITGPAAEVIRNALYSDIPEAAPDYPILSNPATNNDLPKQFIVISLVDDDPDAVQIELFMDDVRDARHQLLQITTKIERGKTSQVAQEGLRLQSDRLIVHKPSLPERQCAVCRLKPSKRSSPQF